MRVRTRGRKIFLNRSIEGQRIVSKLGSGLNNKGKGPLKAGSDKVNYGKKQQDSREGIVKNLKWLGQDGQLLTAGNSGKTPPGQLKKIKGGDGSGKGKDKGGKDKNAEKFQYYYHPDHLGSTSYITDASGEVYQHLEYFAFGETFVEEHSNRKHTPYKFNGKELDEETGLYYYGARYYDAKTSIWLAVDPMAEKRLWVTPYNFVQNNPLTRIDPDGLTDFELNTETGQINQVGDATDTPDRLLDSKNNNVIVGDVDKGLLKDDQNIMKDGLETSNAKGGTKLAVGISRYTKDEIGGTVYENGEGETFLSISAYKHSTFKRNGQGKVSEVIAGFSLTLSKSEFTSGDGSFTGKPKYSFHTHPGHPDGIGNIGTAIPSDADILGAFNSDIPQVIYGARSATYNGQTGNTSITDVPSVKGWNGKILPGGVTRTRMINSKR